jgi:acetyl esterase/lipase
LRALSCASLTVLLILGRLAVAADPPEPRARDHQRVMYFIDDEGHERPVESRADWEFRRRDIVAGVEATMGPLPDRATIAPVRFELVPEGHLDAETYLRERLRIDAGDGDFIPAWLLVPKGIRGRAPAILALHQTNGSMGKDEVVGLAGSPNLHYGLELAQRGYVVLAPDYPTLGEYAYDFSADHFISGSMKGILNHMRCVDLLGARNDVDPERIGAIGHSLGGHNAIFLAIFDPRVKAVVSSCGWTPFHDYYGGDLTGWTGERYIPRIREVYGLNPDRMPWDYYEMIAALAPRAFFSSSPSGDANFAVAGVRKAIPIAREVYDLLGVSDRLQVRYPDCAHDFPPEVREEAYRFLDDALRHKP